MGHLAQISGSNNIVVNVIVADQDFIDSGSLSNSANWIQTSYNTQGGVHLLGGTPLRKNYAGIGYTYDESRDAFIPPQPNYSGSYEKTGSFGKSNTTGSIPYVLNEDSCLWVLSGSES